MRTSAKRILSAGTALLALAVCAAAVLFKLAEHHVAARMRPPQITRETEAANDMAFRTLDGQVKHLADAKGRVVFLNLWGTWCIQCVAEMPTVQQLYDRYRNDPRVEFLVVSRLDTAAQVRLYARTGHYNLPFYVTHTEEIPEAMQLGQYPATFIYAKDGSLAMKHLGAADWADDSVVNFIDRLRDQQ
jgi:thiol-disulfide isomerase/thioredoxin